MRAIETTVRDANNENKFHTYRFIFNDKYKIVYCQYCQTIGTVENNDIIEEYCTDWRECRKDIPTYPQYFKEALQFINDGLNNPLSL